MCAISIVIPANNVGHYMKQTLESVLAQTHSDFELLVYDDGSRDNTWNIIKRFAARDARLRATRQENMTQAATLNRGIAESRYPLVMVFDADDVMFPKCVPLLAVWQKIIRPLTDRVGLINMENTNSES